MSDDKRDTDTMPRPAGCRCHWEAGDSLCPVHPGHDDNRDPEVEALARGLHDRGACRKYDDPKVCDMRDCGAAWFLRQAIQAAIELAIAGKVDEVIAYAVRRENDACADVVSQSASVHEAFEAIRARRK